MKKKSNVPIIFCIVGPAIILTSIGDTHFAAIKWIVGLLFLVVGTVWLFSGRN